MSEASFASLNQTLLARKGGAKPAMRPQLGPIQADASRDLEDLGWNDMGSDEEQASATVIPLTPPAAANEQEALVDDAAPATHTEPLGTARHKQAANRRSPADRSKSRGKRAAFTLRLDPERHMKLKLAAAMRGRSAQQVVTEALDAMLGNIDDLDALAAKMQRG